MLKKVMKNLVDCLENDKFSKEEGNTHNPEEVEEEGEPDILNGDTKNLESGQSIAMYYWGLSHLGLSHTDKVFDGFLDQVVLKHYQHFTLR